jgi:methylenetetrahydrofolate dehydrogenase (NADP+)/methenyltetrahydrofolate cyclohydrolase
MITFDGKAFAQKLEESFPKNPRGRLVVILVGDDQASKIYVNLKQTAARKVGVDFILRQFQAEDVTGARQAIMAANEDKSVIGVMVQLPAPEELLDIIKPEKDVDGLRVGSPYLPATVRAILAILDQAQIDTNINAKSVSVVGANGNVGKRLVEELKNRNYKVKEFDKGDDLVLDTDVVISATGSPNIIKGDMVKQNAIVIDVGAPQGDIDFDSVASKASFITPVPGGVGPVTVVSLIANLIEPKV